MINYYSKKLLLPVIIFCNFIVIKSAETKHHDELKDELKVVLTDHREVGMLINKTPNEKHLLES
jgi:hypothetical protein